MLNLLHRPCLRQIVDPKSGYLATWTICPRRIFCRLNYNPIRYQTPWTKTYENRPSSYIRPNVPTKSTSHKLLSQVPNHDDLVYNMFINVSNAQSMTADVPIHRDVTTGIDLGVPQINRMDPASRANEMLEMRTK